MSTSVVALKYSSVLSPLHPSFSYDKLGHTFRKSSFLNAKKDVGTPINFVPLNELGKKPDFSANLRKIEEETHRQNITERKDFVNQEDNKNTSSKNLFEEFVVMGIDKEEFKNNNSLNEGFDPAKILYIFDSSKNKSVDWFIIFMFKKFKFILAQEEGLLVILLFLMEFHLKKFRLKTLLPQLMSKILVI